MVLQLVRGSRATGLDGSELPAIVSQADTAASPQRDRSGDRPYEQTDRTSGRWLQSPSPCSGSRWPAAASCRPSEAAFSPIIPRDVDPAQVSSGGTQPIGLFPPPEPVKHFRKHGPDHGNPVLLRSNAATERCSREPGLANALAQIQVSIRTPISHRAALPRSRLDAG